ncbi:hypothetical protein [Rhizobium sp. BT04]|uniref:hypothetical protein n=1 Tax=Rhizobium sp. BT04 TaxID=3045157 RepID=UPI0024B3D69B|nr:hypothetical protein [Rhizobium sp. BT04]
MAYTNEFSEKPERFFTMSMKDGKGTSTVNMGGLLLRDPVTQEPTGEYLYTFPDTWRETKTAAGASWWLYDFETDEWEARPYPEEGNL